MPAPSEILPLAVITGAHGVRGELRVKLLNPDSQLLVPGARVWLREPSGGATRPLEILGVRAHQPAQMLMTIAGCSDRDAAQSLRGSELCMARADLPELSADEIYLVDLVGLEVRLADGTSIGVVERTIEYPAAQVLQVRVASGRIEIPLFEPYLVAIELEARAVIVQHVDELDVQPAPRRD